MKNIVVLSEPRSGSGLLMHNLCKGLPERTMNLGEFFNIAHYNICNHLHYLSELCRNRPTKSLLCYSDFLKSITNKQAIFNGDINHKHYELFINHLEEVGQVPYACLKIFSDQYSGQSNTVDINSVINNADYLIVLYRKSVLDRFISYQKALQTSLWFLSGSKRATENSHKKLEQYRGCKIDWSLSEYNKFYEQESQKLANHAKLYNDFQKPKIILSYEKNLNNFPVKDLFETINAKLDIELKIKRYELSKGYKSRPIIQRDTSIQVKDNFNNSLEFESQFDTIKERIYHKDVGELFHHTRND